MRPLTFWDERVRAYIRWTVHERVQHAVLAGSFVLLALTGFALAYPEAPWVRPFFGVDGAATLRGILHRVFATLFLALAVHHTVYLLATGRGRAMMRAMVPRRQDWSDLLHNLRYGWGREPAPASADHFDYGEKAEYLALVWGTVIMGVTGLMLWFEEETASVLPRWTLDLAAVIHLYEAWLATLAILVWHFYRVIFRPDVYPLDRGMVDGRIPVHRLREEHGREWRELLAARRAGMARRPAPDGGPDAGSGPSQRTSTRRPRSTHDPLVTRNG